MRIRTVKPEFFTDSKLREMEPWTRLLFVGLWCFADDEGRFEADVPLIKAAIFPTTELDITEMLAKLEQNCMIKRYKVRKKGYYLIRNWKKHQRIKNPSKPRTPAPPRVGRPRKSNTKSLPQDYPGPSLGNKEMGHGKEEKTPKENPPVRRPVRPLSDAANPDLWHPRDDGWEKGKDLFEMLEPYLPHVRIVKLQRKYPPGRLRWAAERTAAANEVRVIKRPASYLLRILHDDEQWERYLCDQYTLGRAEALQKQKRIARERLKRNKINERKKRNVGNAAFMHYLNTVHEPMKDAVTDYALKKWVAENNIDLDKYRENGWLPKRLIQALYENHVRQIWQALGKPRQFIAGGHILLPRKAGTCNGKEEVK